MAQQIKIGDEVRAHLDARYAGKVLDIIQEHHERWCTNPLEPMTFCIVELKDGRVVKTKITDLYKHSV